MVFLKATWSNDHLETLVRPFVSLFMQCLPKAFLEDVRRVTDALCADKISRLLTAFFERADSLLGLKAGPQAQVKIPHYLLSNEQTRNAVFSTILRMIVQSAESASAALRYDGLHQHVTSVANERFLELYARCYAAIQEEKIGQTYVLIFDPHMPTELRKLLGDACDKFRLPHYFVPLSLTITSQQWFSVHADEVYYKDIGPVTVERLDSDGGQALLPIEPPAVPVSITPIVLCAPWFPSSDDKLRKVIVQPRRGRLQDNLAISRINFRVIDVVDEQYFVHMLRSPPSYDTVEQKQLVTEAKGSRPTSYELVDLRATSVVISFEDAKSTQRLLDALCVSPSITDTGNLRSVRLDVVFASLQWLLDSLNYNELCEITDYTDQSIVYMPIDALEEPANTAAVVSPQTPNNTCKYYECHCGRCRFVFQDIEYTSPNLAQFYAGVRAHPEKYEACLNTIRANIGYSEKALVSEDARGSAAVDAVPLNLSNINLTISFGSLATRAAPEEARPISFHGVIAARDLVSVLFQPSTDGSKATGGTAQSAGAGVAAPKQPCEFEPAANHRDAQEPGGSEAPAVVLTNQRFLRRKTTPIPEAFTLSAFSYIYNGYFDPDTEKILLSIIKNSDNQLELRKYLKIPDANGNLVPVSRIIDNIQNQTYKYPVVLDTMLFGTYFTGITEDGRVFGHAGSGLHVAKQALEGEIEAITNFATPTPKGHTAYTNLFQMTPNRWFRDVSIIYPIEREHFAPEFASGKLRDQDYVLFRNTIIHHYLTTQKRPFKCFVLYDIIPSPVDTICKMYAFMVRESLINYNVESAMSLYPLMFAPGPHQNVRGANAKELSLNLQSLDAAAPQVHRETLQSYSETKFTNPLLQHHALLGATINKTDQEIDGMVVEAIKYMEDTRTPLGVANIGARMLTQGIEEVVRGPIH